MQIFGKNNFGYLNFKNFILILVLIIEIYTN